MRNEFSRFDLAKILHVTHERIKDWQDRGFISPSIKLSRGQGDKNIFSREDVYTIAAFKFLVTQWGISRKKAKEMVKTLSWNPDDIVFKLSPGAIKIEVDEAIEREL